MPIPSKYVLLVFFLVLFLGAMVLGPILYFGLEYIYPVPFHRAMDRALLISALAALLLFWPRIHLKKLWPLDSNVWKQLLLGYAMAAVTAQAMIGFKLAMDGFTVVHLDGHAATKCILTATVAALLVPPLEETIFRGFIQNELSERLGSRGSWIVAALIYAMAHFIKVPVELDTQSVHLWSGFTALSAAIPADFVSGKSLNLFLLGLILGGAFLRAETLWLNAGLHSGLIMALLLFNGFTQQNPHPYFTFLGGDILSSPLTSVVLILLGLWIWRFYRHPSILPETGENAP